MDNLVKALKCWTYDNAYECPLNCHECEYHQTEYKDMGEAIIMAANKITRLEKSNRNWRRKCQRLRKELSEVKKNGIFGFCQH